jgi:hypothetical protein
VEIGAVLLAAMLLSACTSFGPDRVPPDRFDYNEALSRSSKEQMLLNLVRLRHQDVPVFLAVSSVLTQYIYSGNVAATGTLGTSLGEPANSLTGTLGARYVERPTITYSPLTGEDFARQLLVPIDSQLIFSLIQTGFPPDQLLLMSLERINHVENLAINRPSSPQRLEEFAHFQKVVGLLVELARRRAVEMQSVAPQTAGVPGARALVFDEAPDRETQRLIDELKARLGLDPERSLFAVTDRVVRRQPDEVTLRVRSLLTLMTFLSQGIQMPRSQAQTDAALEGDPAAAPEDGGASLAPVRIHSGSRRPVDAFIAVRYQDNWFYVERSDETSKQAFSLLTYLFQLQAPEASKSAPILTVPTG